MNDEDITAKIIKELTAFNDTSQVSSRKVISQVQRVKVQRIQKAVLDSIRDAKDFE